MTQQTTKIPISSIILDEDIYPRKGIDPRRVGIFAENIRDCFKFDPIEVEPDPNKPGRYRLLDGAHRWGAYKSTGVAEDEAVIKNLDGNDPLLYAAKKAIGPKQLTEDEARNTARRAYNKNPALTSSDIGKAIGRARRTVDLYISDLRAANRLGIELKIFRMNRLGIPQDRIAKRLGQTRETIRDHLAKMAELPNPPNADLSMGFTVSQVAEKHNWTEPMVWSLAMEDKEDIERFKEIGWGLRTWDQWEWNDCDKRFGDDWPGRIPAQLIAHILYYFSSQNDLILDPMAGGGVTPDTCLALSRRCWAFDMTDRLDTRPEIEPHSWTHSSDQQLPLAMRFATIEVHDINFAKEVIQQAITNLGDHAKIASIAIDRGFMDGTLLWWLNSEDIIFYIPAKSSMDVYEDALSLVNTGYRETRDQERYVGHGQNKTVVIDSWEVVGIEGLTSAGFYGPLGSGSHENRKDFVANPINAVVVLGTHIKN